MDNHQPPSGKIFHVVSEYLGVQRRSEKQKDLCLRYFIGGLCHQAAVHHLTEQRYLRADRDIALVAEKYLFRIPHLLHGVFPAAVRTFILIDRPVKIHHVFAAGPLSLCINVAGDETLQLPGPFHRCQ